MIDLDLVVKISNLAKLEIPEDKVHLLQEQFSKILQDFKKLEAVNTDGLEPMLSPIDHSAEQRKDRASVENTPGDILANAPEKKGNLFKVPPVV